MINRLNIYLASLTGGLTILVLNGAVIGMSLGYMMVRGFSILQFVFMTAGLAAAWALARVISMSVKAGVHSS